MRKKIEELRNREEGFTLVELLAVIVILGIIVAIAIPAVGSVINTAQEDATAAEKDLVVDAGRMYFTTSGNEKDTWVDVGTLKTEGYLEDRGGEDSTLVNTHGVEKVTEGKTVSYVYKTSKDAIIPKANPDDVN